MKGFLKVLSPFAPDQSGAVSVLYELGGLIIICDAGGCTGNICGFDEPRWFSRKSAVFSAGLRDMDAILGRDDRLIDKLGSAASVLNVNFAALIGTPVPSVIGTDFRALRRMAEKRTGLPVLTIGVNGTGGYDHGEEDAFFQLFRTFSTKGLPVEQGTLGVLGATPLELSSTSAESLVHALQGEGWWKIWCYGMGAGIEQVRCAGKAERNLVVAPAGLKTAEYLRELFGTPYDVGFPVLPENLISRLDDLSGKRVLIVHQQVAANALRDEIERRTDAKVTVASWFMMQRTLLRDGDFCLTEEAQFADAVTRGNYHVVIGDESLRRALERYHGEYWDFPHFAISGRLEK